MKSCKEIYLIGPGRSKLNYDISKLKNKIILNFSGDLVWFCENNIYPTYWTFLDPNSTIYLLDRLKDKKYNSKWFKGLKKHSKIIFHSFQGTDEFYKEGFTTWRGKDWNKNEFGKNILPKICSFFKKTIKLPHIISQNNFDSFYNSEIDHLSPIIRHGANINTDKFICYILPLVLSYFKNIKQINCIGFGDFNESRLYNNNSGGYEGYKISYEKVKNKLIDLLKYKKISIKFNDKNSYFIELENFKKQPTMKKITFCIPSKSNVRYLKTCIPSIRENAYRKDHDIIVFVDSDEDGTLEWLEQVKDQYNIQYYVNPDLGEKLYGIGKAYDYCIEKSTTDIFTIFHADMMLGKDADLKAFQHLKPKTVVCSTRVEPPIHPNGGEKILKDFGMWPEEFKKEEFDDYVKSQLEETKTTEGIFAPWMMYKSEFLEILGGHDPIMHSCREDSDLFNRMLLAGFNFVQPWNSLVYHLTGRGAGSFDGDPERHKQWQEDMNKSTLEFIRKWGTNVNHTPLMKPIVSPVYKKSLVLNNSNPQLEKLLEPWFNGGNDIVIEVDGSTFTQQDFQYIQQLPEILKESTILEDDYGCKFGVGNLTITINSLKTYEKNLIHV